MFKKILVTIFLVTALLSTAATAGVEEDIDVRKVQTLLTKLCYNPGPIDGAWGRKTEAAAKKFFKDNKFKYDGRLGNDQFSFLTAQAAFSNKKCANKTLRFTSNGKMVAHATNSRGTVYFPNFEQLPIELSPPADDATLSLYFKRRLNDPNRFRTFKIQPTGNAEPFKYNLKTSKILSEQLNENSILSYLFYEDGEIIYDGLANNERFSFELNNSTKYPSHSIGKSIVSYLVGHAICKGYLDSLDQDLNDWKLVQNTLYAEQPLIKILNMRARDHHIVTESDGLLKSGRWFNANFTLDQLVRSDLSNTKVSEVDRFNYNGLATNIALNYIIYKTGNDWKKFLKQVFNDHVKIEESVMFLRHNGAGNSLDTQGWYSFFATKYDYLRIAEAMMNDWQSNNCLGAYFKELKNKSVRNGMQRSAGSLKTPHMDIKSHKYGGYFYMDFPKMRNRNILGMAGYGGQDIFIDLDNSRIIVMNAATTNYNWIELGYNAIRVGKLKQ